MADFDVFLSHNSIDKPWVIQLKDDLTRYGVRVWLDKDEIRPGDLFAAALEEALENCSAIALIISPEAMASGWVKEEYYRAVSLSKGKQLPLQMIPVILREAEVPGFVQSRNWIDFRDESKYSENVWSLVWGILGHKPQEVLDLSASIPQSAVHPPDLQTQRYLDAAISRKVKVGQTTELVVLVRLVGSAGLRALFTKDGDYHVQPEDVKTKEFSIEFPVDHWGKQLPLKLCIEIETIDFEVAERRKLIKLKPEKDTEPCIFLLTAKKRGPLKILVQVYLVQDELLLATGLLNVSGMTKIDEGVQNLRALISIPLGAFGVGTKKSLERKSDVPAPGGLRTKKRIQNQVVHGPQTIIAGDVEGPVISSSFNGPLSAGVSCGGLEFKDSLQKFQDDLQGLKEHGAELARELGTEKARDIEHAISLAARVIRGEISEKEWTQAAEHLRASLGKGDVTFDQHNQRIKHQINIGHLNVNLPIAPTQIDPETLVECEAAFRQQVRKRFKEDAFYYINLSGETTELAGVKDDAQAPRSLRRRRQRMAVEYHKLNQEGREIVRVKLNTLRDAVDKYPCVILLGDPGCGKTTALQHLAYEELAGEAGMLPVPLRLSEFSPGMSMEDFIVNGWGGAASAGHWNAFELADNLTSYLDDGKLFCLFDALNEMPHEGYADRAWALRDFINKWSPQGNRFLVTCRVLDYGEELSGLQRVEIQPLNDEQIMDFLQKEMPATWKNLWQEMAKEDEGERSLLKLARNPYMLTVMIDVFTKDGRLGRNRSELMTRFTEILMGWAKDKCPSEDWLDETVQRDALAMMAFEIQDRAGFGTLVKTVQAKAVMPVQVQPDPNWPALPSPPDKVLDLAASAHIIEMTGDRNSLRFYHQLLQEYFAACELLKRDPDSLEKMWRWHCWLEKDMPKWIRPEGNYDSLPPPPPTNWEETTIMAAGLMPENDNRLVQALLEVNPVLAGRCLHEGRAEVALEIRQVVVERLLVTISNPEVALRVRIAAGEVLGYLGDPRIGELVTIPAGVFLMGDDQDDDAKPQHELFLPDYQIGEYPVTNAEFKEFVEAGGYSKKRWWTRAGWKRREKENWTEPKDWGNIRFNKPNQPIVDVSWYECLAYCRWRSAESGQSYRLPTEAEWEKAARGTDGRQYPWGNEFDAGCLNSGIGEQTVKTTTPVGIYPTGKSPNGCLDMAGNVWELTSSLWGKDFDKPEYKYPYDSADERENLEAGDEDLRVLRGGSWFSSQGGARCAGRCGGVPLYGDFDVGFRVVVSPISAL